VIGGIATATPIVLAIINSDRFWMWVALALASAVVVQLLGAYGSYRERERQRASLPQLLDEQIRKGTELQKELRKPLARPYDPLREWDPHLRRVAEFQEKTYGLLFRLAPAYAADLSKNLGPYLEQENRRQIEALAKEQQAAKQEHREVRPLRGEPTWSLLLRSTLDAIREVRKELGD
jgi:hypothetical protein